MSSNNFVESSTSSNLKTKIQNPLLMSSITYDDFTNKPVLLPAAPVAEIEEEPSKELVTVGHAPQIDVDNLSEINLNTVQEDQQLLLTDTNENFFPHIQHKPLQQQHEFDDDSIISQAASSFSQLPSVASTVFSTFSKVINNYSPGSREISTERDINSNQDQQPQQQKLIPSSGLTNIDKNHLTDTNSDVISSAISPAPAFFDPSKFGNEGVKSSTAVLPPPLTAVSNTYRITSKKKTYAQIPGLTHIDTNIATNIQQPLLTSSSPQIGYGLDQEPQFQQTVQQEVKKPALFSIATFVPPVLQNLTNLVKSTSPSPAISENSNIEPGKSHNTHFFQNSPFNKESGIEKSQIGFESFGTPVNSLNPPLPIFKDQVQNQQYLQNVAPPAFNTGPSATQTSIAPPSSLNSNASSFRLKKGTKLYKSPFELSPNIAAPCTSGVPFLPASSNQSSAAVPNLQQFIPEPPLKDNVQLFNPILEPAAVPQKTLIKQNKETEQQINNFISHDNKEFKNCEQNLDTTQTTLISNNLSFGSENNSKLDFFIPTTSQNKGSEQQIPNFFSHDKKSFENSEKNLESTNILQTSIESTLDSQNKLTLTESHNLFDQNSLINDQPEFFPPPPPIDPIPTSVHNIPANYPPPPIETQPIEIQTIETTPFLAPSITKVQEFLPPPPKIGLQQTELSGSCNPFRRGSTPQAKLNKSPPPAVTFFTPRPTLKDSDTITSTEGAQQQQINQVPYSGTINFFNPLAASLTEPITQFNSKEVKEHRIQTPESNTSTAFPGQKNDYILSSSTTEINNCLNPVETPDFNTINKTVSSKSSEFVNFFHPIKDTKPNSLTLSTNQNLTDSHLSVSSKAENLLDPINNFFKPDITSSTLFPLQSESSVSEAAISKPQNTVPEHKIEHNLLEPSLKPEKNSEIPKSNPIEENKNLNNYFSFQPNRNIENSNNQLKFEVFQNNNFDENNLNKTEKSTPEKLEGTKKENLFSNYFQTQNQLQEDKEQKEYTTEYTSFFDTFGSVLQTDRTTEDPNSQRIQNFFNNPPPLEDNLKQKPLNGFLLPPNRSDSPTSSKIVEPPASSACSEFSTEFNSTSGPLQDNQSQPEVSFIENINDNIYENIPDELIEEFNKMTSNANTSASSNVVYQPSIKHWFFRKTTNTKQVWVPFSYKDSHKLEESYLNNGQSIIPVEGGRHDVNITERSRTSVYWNGETCEVRRCSWFYKSIDSKFVPYEEETADLLEDEYKISSNSGDWRKKIPLNNGDAVEFHGPTVIIHLFCSQSVDAWGGSSQPSKRTRVVKRDLDDFVIETGESDKVDHLLFMVHGIGSACDLKFRTVEEVVEEFRNIAYQLVQSHYKNSCDNGEVGRIEVLPISWHSELHSEECGIDEKLKAITLESIPKLRNFANDTVLDVLFYTSPVYCQRIINTVGTSLNETYLKYCERNQDFSGQVSLAGHSLGSLILFDILCHQKPIEDNDLPNSENPDEAMAQTPVRRSSVLSKQISYTIGQAGTGQPFIKHPQLLFAPKKFFAMGSPIGMFVTIRGVDSLGLDFKFPTCSGFYNIFHPYDPVAYRIEALINPELKNIRPVLVPHHKGRKRMHLELKETVTRVSNEFKQKFLDTFKSTMDSMSFLTSKNRVSEAQEIEKEVDKVLKMQMKLDENQLSTTPRSRTTSCNSDVDGSETDIPLGELNNSRRMDYVLQEAPFEFFNEYIFALTSHVCYWDSEDTILFVVKEIYSSLGVRTDSQIPQQSMTIERPASSNSFTLSPT